MKTEDFSKHIQKAGHFQTLQVRERPRLHIFLPLLLGTIFIFTGSTKSISLRDLGLFIRVSMAIFILGPQLARFF